MKNKPFYLLALFLGITTLIFTACDKDFNELGSDIVDDENFGFDVDSILTVKAYNQKLGPIASNNLPINALGFYENPAFGTTQANFVTQVELSSVNPVFNNSNPDLYVDLPVVDSVILDVPYFKTLKTTSSDNNSYRLDSIFGVTPYDKDTPSTNNSKFKLSVFQSGYYLRDLDPGQSLAEQQLFYTDQNTLINDNIEPGLLNNAPLTSPLPGTEGTQNADGRENEQFYFDKREHKLTTYESDGVTKKYTRFAPSMRLHLNPAIFNSKILNAPAGKLSDNSTFKNYFRGIYFKVENGNPGNMAMINFKAGKITIYYKEDKLTKDNPVTTEVNEYKLERISKSYALNFSGNTISLLNNLNENSDYTDAINSTSEASRLYLKGGEGSVAIIDLFGSTDLKGYTLNTAFNENLPVSLTNSKYIENNTPNGISDEIDKIKVNGWLINEANLTFYIDKMAMSNFSPATPSAQPIEPTRIFLFDLNNKKVLADYIFDFTTNSLFPKYNKFIHDGIIQTENVADGRGARGKRYRVRITNFVRNLINNDSTNVRLGLSVTENINTIGFAKLKTPNANLSSAPIMSVQSPAGTILYGTSPVVPDGKRLKLKIYYTKPN